MSHEGQDSSREDRRDQIHSCEQHSAHDADLQGLHRGGQGQPSASLGFAPEPWSCLKNSGTKHR